MRCFAFLSFFIFIFTSCNNNKSIENEVFIIEKKRASLEVSVLDVGRVSFARLYDENQIKGSNSITQAQFEYFCPFNYFDALDKNNGNF